MVSMLNKLSFCDNTSYWYFINFSAIIQRIRIDCVSEANHDLILWLDKPDTWGPVLI